MKSPYVSSYVWNEIREEDRKLNIGGKPLDECSPQELVQFVGRHVDDREPEYPNYTTTVTGGGNTASAGPAWSIDKNIRKSWLALIERPVTGGKTRLGKFAKPRKAVVKCMGNGITGFEAIRDEMVRSYGFTDEKANEHLTYIEVGVTKEVSYERIKNIISDSKKPAPESKD